MDPIESMLRSINPVPDEAAQKSAATLPAMPDLATPPRGSAGRIHPGRRTPMFTVVRATAIAVAAAVVIVAAGFLGLLGEGLLKPEPAAPTPLPAPSSTAEPTPSATPPPSTQPPIATAGPPPSDPATGAACLFRNILAERVAGQMSRNMEAYPGDFNVLGCIDGLLAFELTDTGYQRLLAQGAGEGAFGTYYIARFNVSGYVYDPQVALPGWDVIEPVDGTLAEKAAAMDRVLQEELHVIPLHRPILVGGPPASPDAAPAGPDRGADNPNNSPACSIARMATVGDAEDWVVKDLAAHPENYQVTHCLGGWLGFVLSDAGRQSWLDDTQASGRVHEGGDSFYFAKFNVTAYEFTPGTSVPGWASRTGAGASPESMIASMVQDMEAIGIPSNLRIGLVGEPPE